MTFVEMILLVGMVFWGGVAAFAISRAMSLRAERDHIRTDLASATARAQQDQESASQRLRSQTEAETRLATVLENLVTVTNQRDAAFADRTAEAEARQKAETRAALAEQARTEMEGRLADWETLKRQHLEAAKAAMLDTSQKVSSKLLEDHKREAEAQKKDNAELIKKTTGGLQADFSKLAESVTSLGAQIQQTAGQTEQIVRALSNPAGAGHYAEIGLENMLREFGLEAGRDFIMQHTIDGQEDGSRLRPDAVVFLPGHTVLTIDSKASKFLLEAADAEGTENEETAYADLARSMNQHLRALANKDYASAIQNTYNRLKGKPFSRAINIMYLPTEAAVERLRRADADFAKKAVSVNMVIAGPTALMSYIGFLRIEIDLGRQAENQEKIIAAARSLIDSVGVVVGHVAGVGRGIKAAADSHAKLVNSVNARLLPRQRSLANLGLRQGKQKDVPSMLPSFQVVTHGDLGLIEGESEEVAEVTEQTTLKIVRD